MKTFLLPFAVAAIAMATDAHASRVTLDLGTLGGSFSHATGISARGQVIGNSYTTGDATTSVFVAGSTGRMTNLGTLGGAYAVATAVNDAGRVVGYSITERDNVYHAFISNAGGGLTDLGTLGCELHGPCLPVKCERIADRPGHPGWAKQLRDGD